MSRRYLKCRENSESYLSQSQIIKMKAVQYFRGLSEMVQSSTILCIIAQIIFHLLFFTPVGSSPFPLSCVTRAHH